MMSADDNVVRFPGAAHAERIGRLLIPERLTEARVASRITQTELADRIGVSRQAVSSYEQGEKHPEPNTMARIASELQQPISFFTKESRSTFGKHSANFFRKVGADTKRRNNACDVYARWLSSTAYAFDSVINYPSVDLPSFEPATGKYTDDEIEEFAEFTRQHFGLGLGPISNVVRLLETKGVIVSRYRISGETIEAFSFWSGSRPFIFMSSVKESAARARFDAAHELGHLCLHRWIGAEEIEDKDRLKEIEREADRFAGAFLLPRKSFANEVYSSRADSFINLKARWKVSIQAMVYRAKDLGLFDDRQVTNIYKQISFKKWRTVEPLDKGPRSLEFEEPLLLRKVAELVFDSGRFTVDEFKGRLALSSQDLERLTGYPFRADDCEPDLSPSLK